MLQEGVEPIYLPLKRRMLCRVSYWKRVERQERLELSPATLGKSRPIRSGLPQEPPLGFEPRRSSFGGMCEVHSRVSGRERSAGVEPAMRVSSRWVRSPGPYPFDDERVNWPGRIRTFTYLINSEELCRLSYRPIKTGSSPDRLPSGT